ncbi:DUF4190 domain-containing protein [Nocardia sp. NPDC058658]|uniref:DUF4190 domain-containing protein n=1 Tax=Nocardia sp. NPDC058658 TaxID=3346580 RepID=UPI00365D9CFF
MSYPPPGYYQRPPEHPQATTVLILGALGVAFCGFCAPFAWIKGRSVLAEIDASGGQLGGRSQASAGHVMGIVGTVLLGIMLLTMVGAVALMIIGANAESSSY